MSIDQEWDEPEAVGTPGLVGTTAAGKYLVVRELAVDPRRTIYEAENVELGVKLNLGVVRSDGAAKTEQRLRDGAKLCALREPALAPILEVGKLESGELFVVSEQPMGTTLRKLTANKQLDQRRALTIVRQVLEAVAAAHAIGAIHGDIKPESIAIIPGGHTDRVTLVDLGYATLGADASAADARYLAPECAMRRSDVRSDLYALGAVLYELLVESPPFVASDKEALRRLHAYAPPPPLQQRAPELWFAPALEELVLTALAKHPKARFQTAADMIAAVDAAVRAVDEAPAPDPAPKAHHDVPDDSLLLLVKDVVPSREVEPPPIVPMNVDRTVRELPWWTRALRFTSRLAAALLDRLRRQLAKR
jgi:serine/threonine-protein kinase